MEQLPTLIVIPLLIMSLVVPLIGHALRSITLPLTLLAIATSAGASAVALYRVVDVGTIHYNLGGWAPPVGIEYVIDEITAFVSLTITVVSLFVLVSTRRWVLSDAGDRTGVFYGLVLLLLAGLTGIVVTGDLFNLFVFLEISSLAGYALVFMGGRRAMLAGFRYLIIGSIGGAFYLLGVGFIYFATGTLNMAEARELLDETHASRSAVAGAVFIFVGLGLKMALVPLHLWLPDAYHYSSSAVNSLIAPVMTKVAAYAMLRMFLSVFPAGFLVDAVPISNALVILGLIGILFGSIAAAGQTDIRRMLAYSSISQLAIIAVGIGLSSPLAFVAAMLHVVNHAAMKSTLFLAAASIRLQTGSQRIPDLTGIGRRMPVTMAAFTIAAISMVGIPPSAGFFSKWYLIQAGLDDGGWAVVSVVLLSSLLTAIYLFKVLERAYLRPAKADLAASQHGSGVPHPQTHADPPAVGTTEPDPPYEVSTARESPADVWVPLIILAATTLVLGIFNVAIIETVLQPGVS